MAFKFTCAAALAVLAHQVQGHFTFIRIAHNGEWQEPLRYIRNKTSPYDEETTPGANFGTRSYVAPTYPFDFPESVRCGRDNMAHAANTEVLTVKPGDSIEMAHHLAEPFGWTDEDFNNCPEGRGTCDFKFDPDGIMNIPHHGPVVVHLSKVPAGRDVHEYDGSGEWIKIWSMGLILKEGPEPVHWLPYNNGSWPGRFQFKIPTQTPAGQYLLRTDLIWAGAPQNGHLYEGQLYPSCAQILVDSEISGELPGGGIKIPEDLSMTSEGMVTSTDMHFLKALDKDFVYPGGKLWDGEKLIVDKPNV